VNLRAAVRSCAAFLLALAPSLAGAQNLEPRLYLPLPTGINTVVLSYTHSSGSVIVESAVPVTDFRATSNAAVPAYVRTFGLFGRSAQLQAVVPLVYGTARAVIAGQDTSRDLRGPGDPQLRFSVNLAGGPARRRAQLKGVRFGTIVGASLSLSLPLGDYDTDRRLNVGAHRWAAKPELGVVQPLGGPWFFETYAGVWLFGHNTAFLDTATVTQDPLWALQGHLIRVLGRRGWLAFDGTLVNGGTQAVDGVVQNNFERTVRFGGTGVWFLGRGHALRAAVSTGAYTRFGGDFDVISLGYSYSWGG
jgi:hypothetical protein